ncbi:M48 family metallopeptidase [Winogradskyella sp. SYSU M77433]|uniref:M48 family metallopeptidase n=1 Tax=Winogradskyella sp. SYSU M77433 TaxID=3042722 RepID=UPI00248108F8|nr:M48 family metallopeptidase [Winogradskyella sp. SYSU M77433]MDH7913203.1 M48 family metalloprotease [Winogradskyella sp. SYSU M77433]
MFLPVKKELTIGLGLVSCLNLTEFKAVMSHEFGHFSQRSMKIGSYIISANTIIHDMIFSRDKWDNLLDQWRASDLRLSFAAWIITPIIWLIRQILNLFYQFLNIMYSSLSREMEFNADKVAISTSGSDAIISGLWKLDSGFEKWNNTVNYAYLASQKKMFTKNLYTHNNLSLDRIKEQQSALLKALPNDDRGGKTYFVGSEHSKVNMYASHPPNNMRQDNAKIPFVACEINEDSPWLLFNNKENLQQKMTQLIYEQYINKKAESFSSIEEFENFITSENHGKELLDEFGNAFENRFINIPELDIIEKEIDNIELKLSSYEHLKSKLDELMQPVKEIELLILKANEIAQGTTKDNSFAFKGKTYKKKTVQQGYEELVAEREKLFTETFSEWDKDFCAFHLALAKNQDKYDHLKKLYLQHQELITFYKKALGIKNTIYTELNQLQSQELTENDVRRFGYRVNDLATSLNSSLENFDNMEFIELPNIENVNALKEALIDGGTIEKRTGNIFENGGFNLLMSDIENTIMHCNRIDQKNLGVILDYHKKLQKGLD